MNFIERIKKHPEEILLVFILLAGAVLRFHHLGITSLSNDELSAISRTRFSSFSELIKNGVEIDGHPALVQVLLYYWIKVFGDSVFSIRFPFAIAGIVSIQFIYLLGKNWFGKNTGLFAAAAMSLLQFPLLYSQIARPYIIGTMFTLMAAYFWSLLLFDDSASIGRKKRNYIAAFYIISMSGCMYTHYFSFLEAGIIGITGLFFIEKETWKAYIISGAIILLLFVPHLSIFIKQLHIGGIGFWLPKPQPTFLKTFIIYCFNDSKMLLWLCAGFFIASIIFFRKSIGLKKFHWVAVVWFLLPYFIGYYYSIFVDAVLQYSTLIFAFPFLLLLTFSFIPSLTANNKIIFIMLALLIVICGFSTLKEKKFYTTNHFGVFKEIAEDAILWSDKYGENKMLKVLSVSNPDYINYYFNKMGRKITMDQYHLFDESDFADFMAMTDTSHAEYLLFGRSNTERSYEAEAIAKNKFPTLVESDIFFNSEIKLYKRDSSSSPQKILCIIDFEKEDAAAEIKGRTNERAHSGEYSQKFDSTIEYGATYKTQMKELSPEENSIVTVSAWINCKNENADPKLVLSFDSENENIEWYAANMKSFNRKPGTWQQLIISKPVPELINGNVVMSVYIWNKGKDTFYSDDIKVCIEKDIP